MLKLRILTALVLAPLVVLLVLYAPSWLFALVMGQLFLVGGWEWCRLAGWQSKFVQASFLVLLLISMLLFWFFPTLNGLIEPLLYVTSVGWLLHLWLLKSYARRGLHGLALLDFPGWHLLTGWFLLVIPWLAMVKLQASQPEGHWIMLFLMVLIWVADVAAYFTGKRFGKHKLAPNLSPGKTLEGVAGAILFSSLFALAASFWLQAGHKSLLFVLVAQSTVIFSIAGDLLESMYKREVGLKDSGTLLPGHGGVLDRIDSLTAAAPLFYTGYSLLLLS